MANALKPEPLEELEEEAPKKRGTRRTTNPELERLYEQSSARILQERNDFFLPQIRDFISKDQWVNLRPEYQRRHRWVEKEFKTSIIVDENKIDSPTHAVDCFKGGVAVEMEWNNKDPFFDRDLNNFRLLFDLRAIQVGVIITRAWELQAIFKSIGKGSSYGKATTHHEKLWPKVEGGGGGGCPVLTFAIKPETFVDDGEAAYLALKAKVDAEKLAKKAAKKAGLLKEEEEDEE